MISRIFRLHFALYVGLFLSFPSFSQTLTISSAGNSGTYSFSAGTLTVNANSTITAATIVSWLSSSSLTIVGNTNAISVNVNENIVSNVAGNGLTIGNSNSIGTVTFNNTVNLMGALTVYADKINMGSTVVQDFQSAQLIAGGSSGSISLLSRNGFETLASGGTTRGKIITTGGGNIHINADTQNDNTGQLNIDWLTFDSGSGSITLEASSYSWNTGASVQLPEFYGTGAFTFRNVPGANHIFNTAWIAIFQNRSELTLGSNNGSEEIQLAPCTVCHFSAKNYTGATLEIAGPVNLYGSKVTVDLSLKSSLSGADILLKAKNSIIVNASRSITSNYGDITFWANSDGVANATEGDFIGIQNAVVINSANGSTAQSSGGGTITMAGGTTTQTLASGTLVPTDYAYSNRTSNWGPLIPPGGINFGYSTAANGEVNSLSIHSGGGNIVIKGKSNSSSAGIQWFSGAAGATQIVNSGNGTILFDGLGTSTNAHGIELNSYSASGGVTPTITSSSASSTAIKFVGETMATTDRAGFQGAATLIANATGGGIEISGKTNGSNSYGVIEAGGIQAYALTGPITFIGQGIGGLKIGGTWGKGTLPSSSSNIVIRSNAFTFYNQTIQTTGTITVEPFGDSFTSALSFPITNLTLPTTITGLTLGKANNTANITFASNTNIAGPITAYGGTISVNANLTSTLNGAAILLQGSKVVQSGGTTVQTAAGNITYTATNSPWTANAEQSILVGGVTGSTTTIDSQGGNISLSGTFVNTGVTNTGSNADVAVFLRNTTVKTSGTGTISINGNAYENDSNSGDFIWGVVLSETNLIQTGSGNISITGTPGKNRPNGRGVVADGSTLKVLSASGTINITDAMPTGHTLTNYSGAYFRPASANAIRFGADGSEVASSTSNIIFDVNYITFDVNPTILTSTGALTIRPVATSFAASISTANLSIPSTLTGFTLGKTDNTANLTVSAATTINGPITLHGGTLNLNANLNASNISLNGSTISGTPTLTLAAGSTLTMNLSSNTNYTGTITGTGLNFVKNGAGFLKLLPTPSALSFAAMTISGGGFILNPNQQLSLSGLLTNNGTFTMKDGATFLQKTSGTSIEGNGTFKVEKLLTGNSSSGWSNTSGRFWYMGVPMVNVARSGYGNYVSGSNHVWSYSEVNKQYTDITSNAATLFAGTGYVHRRSTNDTLIFSAIGAAGLYGSDFSASGLTKTAGNTAGVHLISNPYMAYLDWQSIYTASASTNIDPTYYIRTNNTNNISAVISYNASTNQVTNNSGIETASLQPRYIAPMQSIWVRVLGNAGSTGTLNMTRSMLSHQTGNVGLKSSTVFPTLARVNLVDVNNFDQLLVYLNGDMSNEVDEYDSEKMAASGSVQIYTMSSNKKLVMNGLKNNKKKVSVPLYLELPETKSYTLQLSEYMVEDGLILLEDKQEGTIQDFTLMENYTFYANSGLLQNRFVLHFILPNAELATQGPSNNWVEAEEGSYTEGGDVEITNDDRGNIEITLNQAAEQKVEGTVFVTDMNGKEVYNGQLEGIITAIELDVPSGIYYLTVQSGALIEKKKVFIQE